MKKKGVMQVSSFKSQNRVGRIKIFENGLFERFTLVDYKTPFIFWTPIIAFLFIKNIHNYEIPFSELIFMLFLGVFVWSFVEYLIHRFPFHWKCKTEFGNKKELLCTYF